MLALEARERVAIGADDAAAVVAVAAAAVAAFGVEEAERRARLLERVVGPDDDEEGAAEEASARFRLRVSIQEPQPPQFGFSLAKSGDHAITDPIIPFLPHKNQSQFTETSSPPPKPPIRNPRFLQNEIQIQ